MPGKQLAEDEREFLVGLCEQGKTPLEVRGALHQESEIRGWPKRYRNTVTRHYLAWLICTAHGERKEVKDQFYRLNGTDKLLEQYRVYLKQREVIRRLETPGLPRGANQAHVREKHVERLIKLADEVRNCIYNPRWELEPYTGTGQPMWVSGHDWALEPTVWFTLTTPDFDDPALWGPLFASLKEHLAASPFWEHLEQLRSRVSELETMYSEAVGRLGELDPGFKDAWAKYQSGRAWRLEHASRTPLTPHIPGDLRPSYPPRFSEKVLKAFNQEGYGVYWLQWELVRGLQQLNEDFLADRVERIIAAGQCELCRADGT